jgi:putative salt-induced outer membrane protein YdiY
LVYGCNGTALADTLTTKNGDTLQGTVVEDRPDVVIFDSLTFGRLSIGRDAVVSLQRSSEEKGAGRSSPPADGSNAAEAPQSQPGEPSETTARTEPDAVGRFLARINPLKGWKTNFNFGFVARRGDDSDNNLNLRLRSERNTPDGDERLITARYDYGEDVLQDGTRSRTDQLFSAQYQYRHGLNEKFFVQSNSTYYRDVIKELFNEATQTVGLGYRVKGERWRADLTPALGYRVRDISHEWTGAPVVGAYQDYELAITHTLTLRESLQYLVATNDFSDYTLRWYVEINQKLGPVWRLALRYDYGYDAVVGKDAKSLEQRWAFTVGVEF